MCNLNLETKNKQHEILKKYLEENASDILAEKINNGVKIQKDGKTLINKKMLDTFMEYATEEAKKLAEKGARSAMVEDSVVFGWLIHYFEEESIEGILYNEDGTEYKKPTPVKKNTPKPTVSNTVTPPKPKQNEVISMFEGMEDIFMTDKDKSDSNDDKEEKFEEITVDEPVFADELVIEEEPIIEEPIIEEPVITEKPKPTLYDRYMEIQNKYPDHVIIVRIGDFYEIFGDNAKLIGNELEMTITSRELGNGHRFAMIGFPFHASEAYFNKITLKHSIVIRENGKETIRNKIEAVKIENEGIVVDKKTGEIVDEKLPYDIKHVAILAELLGMENLEGC